MTNRRPQECEICGNLVPANGGNLTPHNVRGAKGGYITKWTVAHLACEETRSPQVIAITFSSGHTVYRNAKGTCIDAPCCGCCSF